MRHIALLIPTIDRIGGAERQVILLAKGLVKRRWRVSVVALAGSGGDAARELRTAGVAYQSLGMRKGLLDPRGWFRIHRWINRERPDVVHAHLPHAAWLARWSRITAPVRVLVDSIHSSATGNLGRKLGYRCSDWLPDGVTAVSHSAAEAWTSARMVAEPHLTVLPNGIEVSQWSANPSLRRTIREELLLNGDFVWLTAGRLDPVKDYPTLIQAMTKLPPNVRLLVAGAGPLEGELHWLSKKLGLGQRVRFLGFQPDVARWMQASDAFVLASRWEGLPIALLEAFACELPSVATDVPGTREVISDAKTGLLAKAGNADNLAAAMNRLMCMPPQEKAAMGLHARESVIQKFSIEAILDRWEELYSELLQRNPQPRRWRVRDVMNHTESADSTRPASAHARNPDP